MSPPVALTDSTHGCGRNLEKTCGAAIGQTLRYEKPPAETFERTFGVKYPSVQDKDGKVLLAMTRFVPPQAVPTTLVLDRQGRAAARDLIKRAVCALAAEDRISVPAQDLTIDLTQMPALPRSGSSSPYARPSLPD